MTLFILLTDVFLVGTYTLSHPGKPCITPVDNKKSCIKASMSLNVSNPFDFNNIMYVKKRGEGKELPKGCVIDGLDTNVTYVYWNPEGVALSADRRIRQICF